jgi:hypothetical protein
VGKQDRLDEAKLILQRHELHHATAAGFDAPRGGHDGGDADEPALPRGELVSADATRACGFFAEHAHRVLGDVHSKEREFVPDPHQGPVKVTVRASGTLVGEPMEGGDAGLLAKALKQFFVSHGIRFRPKRVELVAGAGEHQRFELAVAERGALHEIGHVGEGPLLKYRLPSPTIL